MLFLQLSYDPAWNTNTLQKFSINKEKEKANADPTRGIISQDYDVEISEIIREIPEPVLLEHIVFMQPLVDSDPRERPAQELEEGVGYKDVELPKKFVLPKYHNCLSYLVLRLPSIMSDITDTKLVEGDARLVLYEGRLQLYLHTFDWNRHREIYGLLVAGPVTVPRHPLPETIEPPHESGSPDFQICILEFEFIANIAFVGVVPTENDPGRVEIMLHVAADLARWSEMDSKREGSGGSMGSEDKANEGNAIEGEVTVGKTAERKTTEGKTIADKATQTEVKAKALESQHSLASMSLIAFIFCPTLSKQLDKPNTLTLDTLELSTLDRPGTLHKPTRTTGGRLLRSIRQ